LRLTICMEVGTAGSAWQYSQLPTILSFLLAEPHIYMENALSKEDALVELPVSSSAPFDPFSEIRAALSFPASDPREIRTQAGAALYLVNELALAPGGADAGSQPSKLAPEQFDIVGKEIGKALRDNGVKEITVTPGANGSYGIEAKLSKPVTVPQDLVKDGCYQLDIGKDFSATVSKDATGKITIDQVKGMTAKVPGLLGRKVDADIHKIELSKAADGTTQVDTTGSRLGISSTRTRYKSGDVYDGLKKGLDNMDSRKKPPAKSKMSATDLPAVSFA
jgi:hypothetical protein